MRRFIAVITVAAAATTLAVASATGAAADATYHTTRIPLVGVNGAPGSGTVINIHANGPTVYAHEVYLLQHAVAGTYAVTINIFASTDCSGSPALSLPTATLVTNATGNGKADVMFTPADAAPLRGMTVGAVWTADGPAGYVTGCSVITLD